MAQVAVELPAALVPCVRETVLLQYRAALEALHLAFGALDEAATSLEEVRRGRDRLGGSTPCSPSSAGRTSPFTRRWGWRARRTSCGRPVRLADRRRRPAGAGVRGELARRGERRQRPLGGRGGDRPRPPAVRAGGSLGPDGAAEQQHTDHRDDRGEDRHAPAEHADRGERRADHRDRARHTAGHGQAVGALLAAASRWKTARAASEIGHGENGSAQGESASA